MAQIWVFGDRGIDGREGREKGKDRDDRGREAGSVVWGAMRVLYTNIIVYKSVNYVFLHYYFFNSEKT